MTMPQADRRHDPYPFTWEVPVGILTIWLLLAGAGVHFGRALANLTTGAGWTWPVGRGLFRSLPQVLSGDAAAGLEHVPAATASSTCVIGWILTVELLLAVGLGVGAVIVLRRWGPGRMKGMASPAQAESILGVTRLRKVSQIIRPDLYPPTIPPTGGHDGYHPRP